jgi:DNA-binding transcriptional regulator GbsR (MarR family)
MDIIRDLRVKEKYSIDDDYLNGYARLCGVYATAVYNSLSRHSNFNTQKCFPAIKKIAEQHNISKPSVIKGIKALEKWKIIKIIKTKDGKSGRQNPNEYILLDKSQWKKKPRVNEIDSELSESRVNEICEPSQSQLKSRVNEIDHKVTKINVTNIKDNKRRKADKSANPNTNSLIELFKPINPSYELLYSNNTERKSLERMVKKWGTEKVIGLINYVCQYKNEIFGEILTPYQLEKKIGSVKKHYDNKFGSNKNTITII